MHPQLHPDTQTHSKPHGDGPSKRRLTPPYMLVIRHRFQHLCHCLYIFLFFSHILSFSLPSLSSNTIIGTISPSGGIYWPWRSQHRHANMHTQTQSRVVSFRAGCPLHAKLMRLARGHIINISSNLPSILSQTHTHTLTDSRSETQNQTDADTLTDTSDCTRRATRATCTEVISTKTALQQDEKGSAQMREFKMKRSEWMEKCVCGVLKQLILQSGSSGIEQKALFIPTILVFYFALSKQRLVPHVRHMYCYVSSILLNIIQSYLYSDAFFSMPWILNTS